MGRIALKIPNEQQYKFINFYVANGGNASKAYGDAGYDVDKNVRMNAYSLLQRPYIQAALKEQLTLTQSHLKAKILVNLDTMTDKVADLAERCHDVGDRANELSCYQLLMRSRGLLTDNVNVGDTERVEMINRKVIADAKILASIALPKLLDSSKVHNNENGDGECVDNGVVAPNNACCGVNNGVVGVVGACLDSQPNYQTENRCDDHHPSPEQQ